MTLSINLLFCNFALVDLGYDCAMPSVEQCYDCAMPRVEQCSQLVISFSVEDVYFDRLMTHRSHNVITAPSNSSLCCCIL